MSRPSRKRPVLVVMDLTERCNLKCRMCYFSAVDRLRFKPYDRSLSENGLMPLEVFERIAEELFPRAWRVALGCAAEPLIHPKFTEMVEIAGRYGIDDLWFPTNLLALTRTKAEAICEAGVNVVGVSIDGTTEETYESIRIGGKWSRLMSSIELLNEVRGGRSGRTQMRIIFTWMKSNFDQLRTLPEFAERMGASSLDVRFVAPTDRVDNGPELLDDCDPKEIRHLLRETAKDAVVRGLRLDSYPDFELPEEIPTGWRERLRRARWRRRAGLERSEYAQFRKHERLQGCAWPRNIYVVRPNGAVSPCIFWEEQPLGFFPETDFASLQGGEPLRDIRSGLLNGSPIGTCQTCSQRKDALYYRLRRWAGRAAQPNETSDSSDAAAVGSLEPRKGPELVQLAKR